MSYVALICMKSRIFSKDTTIDAKDLFATFTSYLYEYVGDVFIINVIETVWTRIQNIHLIERYAYVTRYPLLNVTL